jgi:orotate phosphoribosyltransferase
VGEQTKEVIVDSLHGLRADLIDLVRTKGYQRRDVPFELASGLLSNDYIDAKLALSNGHELGAVTVAILRLTTLHAIPFDAVGGLTMGADAISHSLATISGCEWFSVRKESKSRGTNKFIEGTKLTPEHRVLLVDDVVTTGSSLKKAYDHVTATGARVTGAITFVDRGETARPIFSGAHIPYFAIVTYSDLGIDPVPTP